MIYLDTFGFFIQVTVPFSLAGATAARVSITNPSGEVATRNAAVFDAAQKLVRYTVAEGDFAVSGNHDFQVVVDFGTSKRLRTRVFTLQVQ